MQVYLNLRLGYWVREVGHEVGFWSQSISKSIRGSKKRRQNSNGIELMRLHLHMMQMLKGVDNLSYKIRVEAAQKSQ